MKKFLYITMAFLMAAANAWSAEGINYNGTKLTLNNEFTRTECGTMNKNVMPETSGLACSRTTPGYLWAHGDENLGDNRKIVAVSPAGTLAMTVKINSGSIDRDDWEDIATGTYNGTNYIFIGAFGDNEETDGNYSIVWIEEPAIDPVNTPEITVTPNQIKYVYPDGKNHNNEALMYDNREQVLYIITKVYYNVCQVFSLPFRTDYGDEVQTLEYVCDLGVKSDLGSGSKPYKGFHLVTGADISPDGKYILIKNHNNIVATYTWVLLFTREDGESVAETLKRQTHPEPLRCYSYEWQGEAICWLDSTTFYTTSDADDGNPPIYKYTKKVNAAVESVQTKKADDKTLVMIDNVMYIRSKQGLFTLDGRKVQ